MSNIAKKVSIIFYIPNSIDYSFFLSSISQSLSTCKCSIPKLSVSGQAFINRETDFRDGDSNIKALTSTESDFSNKDQECDIETLFNSKNDLSTEDQEMEADGNEEILINNKANTINQIQATIEYGVLNSIVLNL